MTLEYIESLEYTTELEKEIKELIIKNITNNNIEETIFNIAENGLNIDTVAFFDKHREDINEAIFELLECWGAESLVDLFDNKFDEKDYLCMKEHNQKLIIDFIVKETCASIHATWNFEREVA